MGRPFHPARLFLFLVVVFLIRGADATEEKSSPEDANPLARVAGALRATRIDDDHKVPVQIRRQLTEFKHRLRDLVSERLNQDSALGSRPPASIRADLVERIKENRVSFLAGDEEKLYETLGQVVDLKVNVPAGHPDLLGVTIEVAASLGRDASLYVYQHRADGWVNILSAEETGYKSVFDAPSSFRYVVSPPAPDGSWFLLTASINPHAASAWQQIRYKVLTAGSDADHPRVLMRRHHTIYLGGLSEDVKDESQAYDLGATPAGFYIRFSGDAGPVTTYAYRLRGGTVTPVPDPVRD